LSDGRKKEIYQYIRFFHGALQLSNIASAVQKWLGMNKFVCTRSHTGSKFSKIFFDTCVQEGV